MSKEAFIEFYQEYLPRNPVLFREIEAITNGEQFIDAVLHARSKTSFSFSREDVADVIRISAQRLKQQELSEDQLDKVAGGITGDFSLTGDFSVTGDFSLLQKSGGLGSVLIRAPGEW